MKISRDNRSFIEIGEVKMDYTSLKERMEKTINNFSEKL